MIFENMSSAETAKAVCNILQQFYKGNDHINFESLRMNDSKSISAYFDQVQTIVNQLRVNGEELQDVQVVEKILRSLAERLDYVFAVIKEAQDVDIIVVDESLCSHERRMNQQSNILNSKSQVVRSSQEHYQAS